MAALEAQSKTGQGAADRYKAAWGELTEALGSAFNTTAAVNSINSISDALFAMAESARDAIEVLGSGALKPVREAGQKKQGLWGNIGKYFQGIHYGGPMGMGTYYDPMAAMKADVMAGIQDPAALNEANAIIERMRNRGRGRGTGDTESAGSGGGGGGKVKHQIDAALQRIRDAGSAWSTDPLADMMINRAKQLLGGAARLAGFSLPNMDDQSFDMAMPSSMALGGMPRTMDAGLPGLGSVASRLAIAKARQDRVMGIAIGNVGKWGEEEIVTNRMKINAAFGQQGIASIIGATLQGGVGGGLGSALGIGLGAINPLLGVAGGWLGGKLGKIFGGGKRGDEDRGLTPGKPIYTEVTNLHDEIAQLGNVMRQTLAAGGNGGQLDKLTLSMNTQLARAGA
jgi:hypothetical protein